MFPIDVLRFSEFRTMRNHLSETLMLNDIQITSDYMSRWVVLKRRVGAVTSQRVLNVLFYVNILQCFFVVENFTANAVSVTIGDNGNRRLIGKIRDKNQYDKFIAALREDSVNAELADDIEQTDVTEHDMELLHSKKGVYVT